MQGLLCFRMEVSSLRCFAQFCIKNIFISSISIILATETVLFVVYILGNHPRRTNAARTRQECANTPDAKLLVGSVAPGSSFCFSFLFLSFLGRSTASLCSVGSAFSGSTFCFQLSLVSSVLKASLSALLKFRCQRRLFYPKSYFVGGHFSEFQLGIFVVTCFKRLVNCSVFFCFIFCLLHTPTITFPQI